MKTQMQETSLEAYFTKVIENINHRQKQVLAVFRDNPKRNFTNMELAYELNWSINRITPRVKELREKGVLVKDTTRECGITHNSAKAWKINSYHLNFINAWELD